MSRNKNAMIIGSIYPYTKRQPVIMVDEPPFFDAIRLCYAMLCFAMPDFPMPVNQSYIM